jgi:hypothetical protein
MVTRVQVFGCQGRHQTRTKRRVFNSSLCQSELTGEDRYLEQDMLRAREMEERRHGVAHTVAEESSNTNASAVARVVEEKSAEDEKDLATAMSEKMDISDDEQMIEDTPAIEGAQRKGVVVVVCLF